MADDPDWAPKQDMSLLCRVCANQHDYLIPIFEGEGLDHDMPTKMEKHLPIKVRENDKLPTQMCYQCASTIIAWSDLHTNCLEADKKLTRMLKINEKKSAQAAGLSLADDDDDDGNSDHYEDAYDTGAGGGEDDEDFEKEIKQLISDAGVELGSGDSGTTKKVKLTKPPAKPAARASRKRKSETTTVVVKRESKKSKSEAAAGSSSSGTVALLKPKEENVSADDRCMVWTCCKCIAKYSSWSQLVVHLLSHGRETINNEKDNAFWCGSCTRSVDTHCNSVDIEDILLCAHCDQVFSDKLLIELHIKIDHRDMFPQTSWFICQVCGSGLFMRLCDIRKHMQRAHCRFRYDVESCVVSKLQDTLFPCQVCGVLCVLSKYCVDHKSSAPASSTLTSSSKCIEHASLFPNCHSCQKCDESFDNCKTLWSHMFLNHENTDFFCNLCPLNSKDVVKYPHLLVNHFKFQHAMLLVLPSSVYKNMMNKTKVVIDGSSKYKCPECSCVLRDFSGLKVHLQIHNRDKEYICHLCNKSFVRQINLDSHIKSVHQKIHNFSCDLCERTFSTLANLGQHMNIHTPSKKHVCEVCGQSFIHKGSLRLHKFSHGTPITCDYCGRNYANPLTLKTHILENHSNLPKHVCHICGKELKTKSILVKHMFVHSNERPFVCPICNATYKMKKHLSHHHRQRHVIRKSQI